MQGMLEGSDPKEALRGFLEVVRMEPEKGEWCVKTCSVIIAGVSHE